MKKSDFLNKYRGLLEGLLAICFVLSMGFKPLYVSNQNTYFIHGLKNAGYGFLENDWLANTKDAFVPFSYLVEFVYIYLHEYVFYGLYILIALVYWFSLVGIVKQVYKLENHKFWIYLAAFLGIHSAFFLIILQKITIINFQEFLINGFAWQSLLSLFFQPSCFGVLLLSSVYFFLKEKKIVSFLMIGIAATFHSSYLLAGAFLMVGYLVCELRQKTSIKKVTAYGLFVLALVVPVLLYVLYNFSSTTPEILTESQSIIANYRIPHHTQIAMWWRLALPSLGIIFVSLFVLRKHRLFIVLGTAVIGMLFLTISQVVLDSDSLALLFPWRLSVALVPLSTSLVLAYFIDRLNEKILRRKGVVFLNLFLVLVMVGVGLYQTHNFVEEYKNLSESQLQNFVKANKDSGDLYLVPTDFSNFRIATGAPIVVDFKSHPYKDTEVLEWYKRVSEINSFYESEIGCNDLNPLQQEYAITHVIVPVGKSVNCPELNQIYGDGDFGLYEIIQSPEPGI